MNQDRRIGAPAILRRWWLLVLLTAVGGVVGYAGSGLIAPVYESTTSILVGQLLEDPELTADDIEASQQLALTYADILRRQPILQGVVDDLGLDRSWQDLGERVQVSLSPDNPQLIVVAVRSGSPEEAALVAAEIADQLIELKAGSTVESAGETHDFVAARLSALQRDIRQKQRLVKSLEQELALTVDPITAESLRAQIETNQRLIIAWQDNYSSLLEYLSRAEDTPNHVQILERAEINTTPVFPDIPLNTMLAAGVGFFLAVGIVYVWEWWARARSTDGPRSADRGNGRADPPIRLREDGPHPYLPRHRAATGGSFAVGSPPQPGRSDRRMTPQS